MSTPPEPSPDVHPTPRKDREPLAEVLGRLEARGYRPRPAGREAWASRCPAHGGRRHNLSLRRGDDGRALLKCFHEPGCSAEAVASALGLGLKDLFPPGPPPGRAGLRVVSPPRPRARDGDRDRRRVFPTPDDAVAAVAAELGEPSACWTYYRADGAEALRVYRLDGRDPRTGEPEKSYRPVHPVAGGWRLGDPPGPLPLPLYRLPELALADLVFVAEGEKAADAVRSLGEWATTSSHGAGAAHRSDWSPLAGKDVVILPDHDEPGEAYARAVIGRLAALTPPPRVKVLRIKDLWSSSEPLKEHDDLADWIDCGVPEGWTPEDCAAALRRAADAAPLLLVLQVPSGDVCGKIEPGDGPSAPPAPAWADAPRPVRQELSPVPTLDADLIPGVLRDWLVDIAERISCPLEFPAAGGIVALGIALGRKLSIRPKRFDDWTVVPNLWGVVVGTPGALKSPSLVEALRPLRELEARAREDHEKALREHAARRLLSRFRMEEVERTLTKAVRNKVSEADLLDLARQLAGDGAPDDEPRLRRLTTSDSTVEALGVLLADNPNLGVIRDELPGWLRSMERPERRADRAFYLEAWDGGRASFTYDRIGRGSLLIPHPTISILGSIQPGPLRDVLREAARGESGDDGLISRFQVLFWPDLVGRWKNVDRPPLAVARDRVRALFRTLESLEPAGARVESGDGGPPFLRFAADAQRRFDDWREHLENDRLRGGVEHPLMESHLAKYRKLIPALALLFHLVESLDRDPAGALGDVPDDALRTAIAWGDLLEAHARRVYSSVGDTDVEPARALLEKLQAGVLPDPFSFRHVYNRGWSRLDDVVSVRRAVTILEDHGWLRTVEVPDTGGAPRTDIYLHPSLPRKAQAA